MKKFFFCAAAAIVALASCSKTQVVYNDTPEEIGFKAVSGVMTKAALGDQGHTTMGVFANYTEDKEVYFDDAQFTEGTEWVGSPAQYWPLTGSLDFAFYAPYNATAASRTYTASPAANTMSIIVDNSTTQTDWLYGTEVLTSQTKKNTAMPVTLRHALAKITVNVTSDLNDLVINSVKVTDTAQSGTLTVDYAGNEDDFTDGDSRLSWTGTTKQDWMIIPTSYTFSAVNVKATGTCYVIPSGQTTIVMSYNLPAGSPLTYTHTLSNSWVDGISYTYNISIGANEIKFNPTEGAWGSQTPVEIPVDPNTPNN